jgi:hypothetical protein
VELKAQSGENSQLFMENSIVQNTQSFGNNQSLMMSQGATGKQGPYSHQLSMNSGERPRITINLMDVSFLEQNLSTILEVSTTCVK